MKSKFWKILLFIVSLFALVAIYFLWKPTHFVSTSKSGIQINCERGKVTVSEVRDNPTARRIDVNYIRLKSFSETPKTPIFYLAGGPGDRSLYQAEHPAYLEYWSNYLKERDIILIDQRGAGKWNMYWINFRKPPNDFFVSEETASRHFLTMAAKAMKAFQRRGIDLNGYNSIESAQDIDDIRKQLGYEKIIPFGFSYGTHLGQTYLKYHGDQVEKAILIGVEGLNHNFKMPSDLDQHFEKIARLVAQDTTVNRLVPDFKALYQQVSSKLEKEPITLTIQTPIKISTEVKVGKFGLDYILKRDIGDANDLPVFPKLLYTIHQEDYSVLKHFVEKRYREFLAIPGMFLSMDLASGGTEERLAQVAAERAKSPFGIVANAPINVLHKVWPVKDLGDDFRKPIQSNIPTLFLSGSLDINTPAYQAEEVSKGFPNSTHLVVENAGHEQIRWHWEMTPTILSFLEGADISEVDMAYPPIRFYPVE